MGLIRSRPWNRCALIGLRGRRLPLLGREVDPLVVRGLLLLVLRLTGLAAVEN